MLANTGSIVFAGLHRTVPSATRGKRGCNVGLPLILLLLMTLTLSLHAAFASLSKDIVTGLNLLKKGSDPPLKADEELPEWLWALAEPGKTLNELKRAEEAGRLTLDEASDQCR
jgi:hypothetical protein